MWYKNRELKWCRWCQMQYYAHKPEGRDGFCSARCKQAHYRAFKKYVTANPGRSQDQRTSKRKR